MPVPGSMMGGSSSTEYVYHYTDEKGLLDILTSGVIKATELKGRDDAFHGEGVYLTGLAPSRGKYAILINNYDRNGWGSFPYRRRYRADCYVKFEVAELRGVLQKRRPGDGKDRLNRDIWLFPGPIELKYYPHYWLSHDYLGEIYADRKAFKPAEEPAVTHYINMVACWESPTISASSTPFSSVMDSDEDNDDGFLFEWDGLEPYDEDNAILNWAF